MRLTTLFTGMKNVLRVDLQRELKNTHYDAYSFPDKIYCFQDDKQKGANTTEQLQHPHISESTV
jgi:hypothetical protein